MRVDAAVARTGLGEAAQAGADVSTIPFKVLAALVHHPMTDKGNAQFMKDWSTVPNNDVVAQVTAFLASRA